MGSKSNSNQSTSNQQQTNNIVNDGQFAGVGGSAYLDESDHSIDDSYNTDIDNDIDNSISVEDGGNFAQGDITLVDAGSIAAAQAIAEKSLEVNGEVVDSAFEFGENVFDEFESVATSAMSSVENVSRDVVGELRDFGGDAIDYLSEQSETFADNLESVTGKNITANQAILDNISNQSTTDKAIIAELAKNTALQGQDIVAKSSEKMVMYMAMALGLGFLFMAYRGSK